MWVIGCRYFEDGDLVRVPVNVDNQRIPDVHKVHAAEVAANVPKGYLQVVGGAHPAQPMSLQRRMDCRIAFTTVPRSELHDLERHWTADEILQRAKAAAAITAEEVSKVQACLPLHAMTPVARKKAWIEATKAANARHLALGVAGLPVFAELPYFRSGTLWYDVCPTTYAYETMSRCVCRCENICHFAVAHLFLYGLLKDFFAIWSDHTKPTRRGDLRDEHQADGKVVQKAIYAWPSYIQRFLVTRMQDIVPTRQWSIAGADVTRYLYLYSCAYNLNLGCVGWQRTAKLTNCCSRAGWRMEDYITCLDVFSPFLFFNLPWKSADARTKAMFERQWTSLRSAIMIILRPETSRSLTSQVAEYRRYICAYGAAVKEVWDLRKVPCPSFVQVSE